MWVSGPPVRQSLTAVCGGKAQAQIESSIDANRTFDLYGVTVAIVKVAAGTVLFKS